MNEGNGRAKRQTRPNAALPLTDRRYPHNEWVNRVPSIDARMRELEAAIAQMNLQQQEIRRQLFLMGAERYHQLNYVAATNNGSKRARPKGRR